MNVLTLLGFTHVDPFEDTESDHQRRLALGAQRFTHVDPFEDTESQERCQWRRGDQSCFTHVDPFEDTERFCQPQFDAGAIWVSPTSIRSRILKVLPGNTDMATHAVSPTSIRSRILKVFG